jgi:hypothetical protein
MASASLFFSHKALVQWYHDEWDASDIKRATASTSHFSHKAIVHLCHASELNFNLNQQCLDIAKV